MNKNTDNDKNEQPPIEDADASENSSEDSDTTWSLIREKEQMPAQTEKKSEKISFTKNLRGTIKKCPLCNKDNESDREFCWACFCPLEDQKDRNDRGVIIRKSYLFIPDDEEAIKHDPLPVKKPAVDYDNPVQHSDRIPVSTGQEVIKSERRDIQIFKGSHLIAVRIDGKNYTSEDINIPREAKMIIRRVQSGESINDILNTVRKDNQSNNAAPASRPAARKARKHLFEQFRDNFSILLIIGFSLILLFQLLFTLRNCG